MPFDLSKYEPVDARIGRFYFDHPLPEGRIRTRIVQRPVDGLSQSWVVRARVYVAGELVSDGHAEEVPGDSQVNRTSALENCETSAIGRALANAGYSPAAGERATREEMQNADESRRRIDHLRDRCKEIVAALDDPAAKAWKAWKQDHPNWYRTEGGYTSALATLYELAPDHAGEPFDTDQANAEDGAKAGGDDEASGANPPAPDASPGDVL